MNTLLILWCVGVVGVVCAMCDETQNHFSIQPSTEEPCNTDSFTAFIDMHVAENSNIGRNAAHAMTIHGAAVFHGPVNLATHRITNLADPVQNSDAMNKNAVIALLHNLSVISEYADYAFACDDECRLPIAQWLPGGGATHNNISHWCYISDPHACAGGYLCNETGQCTPPPPVILPVTTVYLWRGTATPSVVGGLAAMDTVCTDDAAADNFGVGVTAATTAAFVSDGTSVGNHLDTSDIFLAGFNISTHGVTHNIMMANLYASSLGLWPNLDTAIISGKAITDYSGSYVTGAVALGATSPAPYVLNNACGLWDTGGGTYSEATLANPLTNGWMTNVGVSCDGVPTPSILCASRGLTP